jgi:3-deoxy-manno-octulosonate cytidylyltransferase (CMP-KDO synthetase)
LEQMERLEQLRALENGYQIVVGIAREPTIGVDTLEDVGKLEPFLS